MARSTFVALAAITTLGGLAAVVGLGLCALELGQARWRAVVAALAAYAALLVVRPGHWAIIDVTVIAAAAAGALLLERSLATPGAVGAFLTVAAVVDLASMWRGPSRALVQAYRAGRSDFLIYLTLVVPINARIVPIVGIGDLLVGGAAAIALVRMRYPVALVFAHLAVGLLLALAYGLWRGGAPALPFVAPSILLLILRLRPSTAADRSSGRPPGTNKRGPRV